MCKPNLINLKTCKSFFSATTENLHLLNRSDESNDILVAARKRVMLVCQTDIIGYRAKIKWSAPPGIQIDQCDQNGLTYICSSKLYFTPSYFDNRRDITCSLTDEASSQYLEIERGRLTVGGILYF